MGDYLWECLTENKLNSLKQIQINKVNSLLIVYL